MLGLESSLQVEGGHGAAVLGPKVFLGGWQTPFVGVACTPGVGAQPWFAVTNTTLVQGQVFEDYPQVRKGLIPGMLNLGSGSTQFVPAVTGTVHIGSLHHVSLWGIFSGRDMMLQACFHPFCPGVCACSALWWASSLFALLFPSQYVLRG